MPYKTNTPARPIVPTPVTATVEVIQATEARVQAHFAKVFTPELLIAQRKATYATVINSTNSEGLTLEQQVGSENAKILTTNVLNSLLRDISTVPSA